MPITATWDNAEQTIIRVTFLPEWTWSEFFALSAQIKTLLDMANHRVCIIADMRSTSLIPTGLSLNLIRPVFDLYHANADIVVVVGISSQMRKFFNAVIMALGETTLQMQVVKTINEAYTNIQYRMLEIERARL